MKKVFYSILLFTVTCGAMVACNNGDYDANPDSPLNMVINPLNPLKESQFTWTGSGALSCTVNGVPFVADSANTTWSLDTASNGNTIVGLNGTQAITLYLMNVSAVNLYTLSNSSYYIRGTWIDSVGSANPNDYYYSYLGNSGEVYITENDSAYIAGKFYFEGISDSQQVVAVNNGYFKVAKLK